MSGTILPHAFMAWTHVILLLPLWPVKSRRQVLC